MNIKEKIEQYLMEDYKVNDTVKFYDYNSLKKRTLRGLIVSVDKDGLYFRIKDNIGKIHYKSKKDIIQKV